jgi:hypothetical protein
MADSWQEYQEEVATFFRSLGLEAITNLTVQGVRTTHDIDVFVKSHHVGFVVVWISTCPMVCMTQLGLIRHGPIFMTEPMMPDSGCSNQIGVVSE